MADITKNPIILTTADVGATDHIAAIGTASRLRIHAIRWVGATTAGHGLIINDTAGRTMFSSTASAANFVDHARLNFWFRNGLVLNTLASGTVYIYIQEGVE